MKEHEERQGRGQNSGSRRQKSGEPPRGFCRESAVAEAMAGQRQAQEAQKGFLTTDYTDFHGLFGGLFGVVCTDPGQSRQVGRAK